MDTDAAVAAIADVFAEAEQKAGTIRAKFRGTKDAWEALRDNLVIGGLEMQAHFRDMDALATKFEADLFVLHSALTERAKDLGVDLPSIAGGGGR